LDATTIDLCLSLFDWAPFRSTKAVVKMHTLLNLRGNIPAFIHVSDGKMHDVNVLDILPIEAGAFYVMDRGYLNFARLYFATDSLGQRFRKNPLNKAFLDAGDTIDQDDPCNQLNLFNYLTGQ
jgi:Transposase DDE domain